MINFQILASDPYITTEFVVTLCLLVLATLLMVAGILLIGPKQDKK
jgi:hypothetical protein